MATQEGIFYGSSSVHRKDPKTKLTVNGHKPFTTKNTESI